MDEIELVGDERDFYAWLAGFLDGEGSFNLTLSTMGTVYAAKAQVSVRCDDWRVIQMIWERTGLGSAVVKESRPDAGINPQATWWVLRALECRELVRRLRAAGGLRAKKRRDFELWSDAVDLLCDGGGSVNSPNAPRLAELKAALHAVKLFDPQYAEGFRSLAGVTGNGTAWLGPRRLLHYHKLTDATAQEIVRLHDDGLSQKELAIRFNLGEMTVSRLVNGGYARVGGSERARANRLTLEQIDALVARYKEGEKPKALQEEYKVSKAQFYRYTTGNYDRRYHRSEA